LQKRSCCCTLPGIITRNLFFARTRFSLNFSNPALVQQLSFSPAACVIYIQSEVIWMNNISDANMQIDPIGSFAIVHFLIKEPRPVDLGLQI
jgi:hypothetical protein